MRQKADNIILRIPYSIHQNMLIDLRREHPFAAERVGFLYTKSKRLDTHTTLILAFDYKAIEDEYYINDDSVGAKIGSAAIREAMQEILDNECGCFHVHLHDHYGKPTPSKIDQKGLPGVVKSFFNISVNQVNGFLILSTDSFYCSALTVERKVFWPVKLISVIGYPMQFHYLLLQFRKANKIFDRQSFLGKNSQALLESVRIGIVGYGGGGSHIGQQLAHIGVQNLCIFDNDVIEDTNLNRLVGGLYSDILKKVPKTEIAKRLIKRVLPKVKLVTINSRWQDNAEVLQNCDIVVGCIDSYSERQQLEAECRRYLIPLVDIGMDVHQQEGESPSMSGQVILSMPNMPCMQCYGFLTEKKLELEAAKYGNTGGRPQVIWPNGVLASTAIGIMMELITGWSKTFNKHVYLEYDGNQGTINEHIRAKFCPQKCQHYSLFNTGPQRWRKL